MRTVKSKLLVVCIVVSCLMAAGPDTAFADRYFSILTGEDWDEAVMEENIRPMQSQEWDDYMLQFNDPNNLEGEPYPETTFLPPSDLYVYDSGDEGVGLVMAWGNSQMPEGQYASAWVYEYGEDPDLSNSSVTIQVEPPCGITTISVGLRDINLRIRSWRWNVAAVGVVPPLPLGTLQCSPDPITGMPIRHTITINLAQTGVTAATPQAASYSNYNSPPNPPPTFDITQVQSFVYDEDANFVAGSWVPPPGLTDPKPWNYWFNLTVTPNPPPGEGKFFIKWSQPPVLIDPHAERPVFNGWDERSDYNIPPIVADDWLCQDDRPVTDIHWWGSLIGWDLPLPPLIMPKAFHIGIWTDVPVDPGDPMSYSHPGTLIWENYCDNWVWNFAGYDKAPTAPGQLIADNPTITYTGTGETFGWSNEWWFRGGTTAAILTFNGINTALISGNHVFVNFNLGVTNHMNGDFGLDGLVDITINPGSATSYTVTDVLFDNLDPTNVIGNWPGTGTGLCPHTTETYETTASLLVHKNNIQAGTLVIKIHRSPDNLDNSPAAPCGMHPIDTSTSPPTVPLGCYDFDDAHTVHINVRATDATGTVAANGEVTILDAITPGNEKETCFQFTQLLSQDEWFYQEPSDDPDNPTIYWLSIAAIYNPGDQDNPNFYPWGWKTRPHFFNDDAVRIIHAMNPLDGTLWPPTLTIGSNWMDGGPIFFPTKDDTWDLAFELTTNEGLSADVYRDGIVNFKDLAVLANQWLMTVP